MWSRFRLRVDAKSWLYVTALSLASRQFLGRMRSPIPVKN